MSFRSDLESSLASVLRRTGNSIMMHVYMEQMLNLLISVVYTVTFQTLRDYDHCDAAYLNSSCPLGENINNLRGKNRAERYYRLWNLTMKSNVVQNKTICHKRPYGTAIFLFIRGFNSAKKPHWLCTVKMFIIFTEKNRTKN